MKKILFIFIVTFIFMNSVKANEWQEELLTGEKIIGKEYRYRFYKEIKEGEYLTKGTNSNYQFEDYNDIIYDDYIYYEDSCPNDLGYEVEYVTKYVYKKRKAVKFIEISNSSEYDLNISNIRIKDNNNFIKYEIIDCVNCTSDFNTIGNRGGMAIELEYPVYLGELTFILEFSNKEIYDYQILYMSEREKTLKKLIAISKSNTSITEHQYDNNYILYANYDNKEYTDYNIKVNDLISIISQEKVCRGRSVKTYHYNINKEYYDDSYYKDVTLLSNLTEEERKEYKKDLEDYKIFYRYEEKQDKNISIEDNEIKTNDLKLVNTGVEDRNLNYNYLILFILFLILLCLILIKYIKTMSNENDD